MRKGPPACCTKICSRRIICELRAIVRGVAASMDCGSNEFVCQFFDWLSRHPNAIKQTLEFLDGLWSEAGGQLIKFLKEHGEKLIAIASFSFGVYRWWIYRERILHKRLEEYIRESDARLGPASVRTVDAILKPGRTAALPQPAFAVELQDILVRSGFDSFLRVSPIEKLAERKLSRSLRGIRKRQQIARAALQSLLEQQTHVHLLAGAIATSRARRKVGPASGLARGPCPAISRPHNRDALAKECEAFQLLRLNRKSEAFQAYLDLENIVNALSGSRAVEI